jgi:hypothetical protein
VESASRAFLFQVPLKLSHGGVKPRRFLPNNENEWGRAWAVPSQVRVVYPHATYLSFSYF